MIPLWSTLSEALERRRRCLPMSASPFWLKSDPFANTVSHLLRVARPAVMFSIGGSSSIRVKPKMLSHCKAVWSTHLVNAWTEWWILGVAMQKLTWHVGTTMIPLWSTLFTTLGSRRWPLMSFRFRTISQSNITIWRCDVMSRTVCLAKVWGVKIFQIKLACALLHESLCREC